MGIREFVHHGHHQRFLGIKDATPIYPGHVIKLYDIGEESVVGAEYPDGARQVQPVEWQSKEVLEAFHNKQQQVRPQLNRRSEVPRPALRRR